MSGRRRILFRAAGAMISDDAMVSGLLLALLGDAYVWRKSGDVRGRYAAWLSNSESWRSLRLLASAGCQKERKGVASMGNAEQQEPRGPRPGQPSLAARGERRRIERRLQEIGVLCQPEVSLQYQTVAKRSVLREVESGGATKEIGRYVTFCDERGESIPWLQPIDSVAVNGRHAVVVAPALVSVEVFRVRNTYDVLIVRHDVVKPADGRRGRIEAKVLFRGRQGYLPLDLTGDEKNMAGQIVPEFFSKAGEHIDIPAEFGKVLRAAVRGAACVNCTHQHYLTAPKLKAADGPIPISTGEQAVAV